MSVIRPLSASAVLTALCAVVLVACGGKSDGEDSRAFADRLRGSWVHEAGACHQPTDAETGQAHVPGQPEQWLAYKTSVTFKADADNQDQFLVMQQVDYFDTSGHLNCTGPVLGSYTVVRKLELGGEQEVQTASGKVKAEKVVYGTTQSVRIDSAGETKEIAAGDTPTALVLGKLEFTQQTAAGLFSYSTALQKDVFYISGDVLRRGDADKGLDANSFPTHVQDAAWLLREQ